MLQLPEIVLLTHTRQTKASLHKLLSDSDIALQTHPTDPIGVVGPGCGCPDGFHVALPRFGVVIEEVLFVKDIFEVFLNLVEVDMLILLKPFRYLFLVPHNTVLIEQQFLRFWVHATRAVEAGARLCCRIGTFRNCHLIEVLATTEQTEACPTSGSVILISSRVTGCGGHAARFTLAGRDAIV